MSGEGVDRHLIGALDQGTSSSRFLVRTVSENYVTNYRAAVVILSS